ncbi:MAG: YibE/F family protein [Propionibacteriaceae bacterium]
MSHPHHPAGGAETLLTAEGSARHLKALRMLVVILIPVAVWTIAGLVVLWPDDLQSHIRPDLSTYTVAGVTLPKAEITEVNPVACDGQPGSTPGQTSLDCADVKVKLLQGPDKDHVVDVALNSAVFSSGAEVGQQVRVFRLPAQDGTAAYQFADFERGLPLLVFGLIFVVVVCAVARWRGFAALVGLAFAGFILVAFMFPALVAGSNPLAVGLFGSTAIMFVVLYAAHGFSARTTTALVGTLFGLLLTAGLGWVATTWAHLTGVASDDDFVLAATAPDLKLTSVVICGIILAGLGVLNDVTITQASAVWELADSDKDLEGRDLFSRAMRIGRDHIASTVYTIAFATAGTSLGVLLLIAIYDRPLLEVLQTEMFAAEVLSILVGSIGLVLAVPLTTAIGVAVVRASTGATRKAKPSVISGVDETPAGAAATASGSGGGHGTDQGGDQGRDQGGTAEEDTQTLRRVPANVGTESVESVGSVAPTPAGTGTTEVPPADAAPRSRRFRRARSDDDFGFADLHDPDPPPRRPSDD